jgi:hypothetical protein
MKRSLIVAFAVAITVIAFGGCSGAHKTRASGDAASKPVVEAFLEYVGPPQKWAGPSSFVVHVTARDLKKTEVAIFPAQFAQPLNRAVASTASTGQAAVEPEGIRDQLAELAGSLSKDSSWYGCLYPVRVRLIREDGSLLDKYGCRGQDGWPAAMGRTMGKLIPAGTAPRLASNQ